MHTKLKSEWSNDIVDSHYKWADASTTLYFSLSAQAAGFLAILRDEWS